MANEGNLIPNSKRTPAELREIARKGGKASQKKARERKAMREQMEMLLSLPIKDERTKKKFEELGIESSELTNQMALIVATFQNALKGNTNAMNIVRELVGERIQEVHVTSDIDAKVKELDKMLDEI